MSDSFITIMIVLIAAVLIFVVPVMSLSKRIDVTASQDVQSAVSEFVDKTRKTGMIKKEDYDQLLQKLEATGNVYEVEVNIQYIDENPSKKTSSNVLDSIKIGENVYYIEYTTQVEEAFEKASDGIIRLESGDYIKVDIQNKNQTIYQNFKKTLYNLSGGSVGEIEGVHVGLVIETTDGEQIANEHVGETQQKYEVKYDANGGIQTTCPMQSEGYIQKKNKGEDLVLSFTKPLHSDSSLKFAGWSEEANATEATYSSGGIFKKDKNTTLYAVWKRQLYNVVYLSNYPTAVAQLPEQDSDLQEGDTYEIWNGRERPKAEGATFVEWNTSPDGEGTSYNSGDIITINDSLILYAIWEYEEAEYILIFNANGGKNLSFQTKVITKNSTYGILPTCTREGYDFEGWYTASTGGTKIEESTIVEIESDQTLYAQWIPSQYMVYFDKNGGNILSSDSITVTYDSTYGTLPTCTREGYTFEGWYTAQSGGTKIESDTIVKITGDQTLYAHWTQNKYTVYFDKNGGNTISSDSITVTYDSAYGTLPTCTREGYSFKGWYTASTGGTKIEESTIVQIVTDQTLYAQWIPSQYTVYFDKNGGNILSSDSITVTYGSAYGTLPTCTREGYDFEGWYTASTGGTKIEESTIVEIESDQTLYAHWTPNKYTIYFDKNGGNTISSDSITVTYDSTYGALPTCTRKGYSFEGWYTAQSGGSKIESDTIVKINGDQTLYAHWIPNKYTVYFAKNGGNIPSPDSITVIYDSEYGTLATCSRTDYSFEGWYTEPDGGTKIEESTIVRITSDQTLYAHWRREKAYLTDLSADTAYFKEATYKTAIKNISFVKYVDTTNAVKTYDLSVDKDNSITGWIIKNTDNTYDLYIGADCYIYSTTLSHAFDGMTGIQNITFDNLNTSETTTMENMFYNCNNIESLDVTGFDTSNVTDMKQMFENVSNITTLDLSNFDTSKVENMSAMFKGMGQITKLDVSNFDTSKVTNMIEMFSGCSSLSNLDVTNFNTQNVTNMTGMFYKCGSLKSLDVTEFNTQNVTNMANMFFGCSSLTNLDVSNFNTSKVNSMYGMFYECKKIESLDVTKFNTEKCTSMGAMFSHCNSLTDLDVSGFKTSAVQNMSYMFNDCTKLTALDVSNFDTSNVKYMEYMFRNCSELQSINVSNFDTSNVTNMKHMFEGLSKITTLDVSNFKTSKVQQMHEMFRNMSALQELNLSNFDTTGITNNSMYGMFMGCKELRKLDISNFKTENIIQMTYMFNGCEKLTYLDFRNASFDAVTEYVNVFWCESYEGNLRIIVKDAEAKAWIEMVSDIRPRTVIMVSEL